MFLTPASQLAIVGVSSNTMLRVISKGKEASPKEVLKELGLLAVQTATIIAAQKTWQLIVSRNLLNPVNTLFASVYIPVVVGGVTSYVIDDEEGLQNYFQFLDVVTDGRLDEASLLTAHSIATIFLYYRGGGKNRKQGAFEYYS